MGTKRKPCCYAVKVGAQPGIYGTWEEAKAHVNGYRGAVHKGFVTLDEAQAWMAEGGSAAAAAAAADAGSKLRRLDWDTDVSGAQQGRGVAAAADGRRGGSGMRRAPVATLTASGSCAAAARPSEADGAGAECGSGQGGLAGLADVAAVAAASAAAGIDPALLYQLEFDGASRGNPGRAGVGAVLREAQSGAEVAAVSYNLGRATNNQAEYCGLLLGMQAAAALGVRRLKVLGDSKLVVQQVEGAWAANNGTLRGLCQDARAMRRRFEHFSIAHVLRDGNKRADALSNVALDSGGWEGVRLHGGQLLPLPRARHLRQLCADALAASGSGGGGG